MSEAPRVSRSFGSLHAGLIFVRFAAIVMAMIELELFLREVATGALAVDAAAERLRGASERDLGFARLDMDRLRRCGIP